MRYEHTCLKRKASCSGDECNGFRHIFLSMTHHAPEAIPSTDADMCLPGHILPVLTTSKQRQSALVPRSYRPLSSSVIKSTCCSSRLYQSDLLVPRSIMAEEDMSNRYTAFVTVTQWDAVITLSLTRRSSQQINSPVKMHAHRFVLRAREIHSTALDNQRKPPQSQARSPYLDYNTGRPNHLSFSRNESSSAC